MRSKVLGTIAAVLALAGCGRVTRDPPSSVADASAANPDSGANRACVWNGFAPEVSYPDGDGPDAIAIADLNHDARPDLVVANWGRPLVLEYASASIFLNQARGAFATQVAYPADIESGSVGVGDFNGDGYADVAVLTALGHLDVLINAGDGTLEPFVRYEAGESGGPLAVADFDGDGQLDLAIAMDFRALGVFFGKGDGSFAAAVSYPTGSAPDAMSASDVNGDGHVDLVLTNVDSVGGGRGILPSLGAGTVNVLMNLGNGTFAPQVSYAAGTGTTGLAVADLNGDGHPDFAAVNSVDRTLGVYLNAGDGTFGMPTMYANGALAVSAADFNGDGQVDLAIVSASPPDGGTDHEQLQLLLNLGGGAFSSSLSYPVYEAGAFTAGDLNADGLPDLAVIDAYDDTINVFLSTCQ